MPEPEQRPAEDAEEIANDTIQEREQSKPAVSNPETEFCGHPTEAHPHDNQGDCLEENGSFDPSVLTQSSNRKSMGRLAKYEVIELIGQGGMGVVLRGFDESLGRQVAIKMLSRQLASSSTARRRFTREGRAAAAIWPLVGFSFTLYEFREDLIIKTLQPIFRDGTGKTETSEMVGRLHPKCEFRQVIADPGYAVSGIEAMGGNDSTRSE